MRIHNFDQGPNYRVDANSELHRMVHDNGHWGEVFLDVQVPVYNGCVPAIANTENQTAVALYKAFHK